MDLLPEFIYDPNLSFEKKIYSFNHHVYSVFKEKRPDLIVIGVPGGIAPLNNNVHNHFCEIPLIISSALQIDSGILNLYLYNEYPEELFGNFMDYCIRKYRIPIDAFCITPHFILYNDESKRQDWSHYDEKSANQILPELSYPGFDTFYLGDYEMKNHMMEKIIDSLEENLDILI